ncbi:MAG: hypothetical protein Q9207_005286 [Kuettlingeria erythrocarpa]
MLASFAPRAYSVRFGCLPCCCQNPDDDCELEPPRPPGQPAPPGFFPDPKWSQCNARPRNGQKWACEADNLDFPTVECLVQDIKTCDVVNKNGASTVFYSFGVATVGARQNVRDKLIPKGVMFNDGLMNDGSWDKVLKRAKYAIGDPTIMDDPSKKSHGLSRNNIFVARMSEALARVSTNDVYFVYGQEVGEGGKDDGLGGVYQLPRPVSDSNLKPVPNAWRTYEFPTLQKYSSVNKIYGVDGSTGYPLDHVEWTRGTKQKELPDSNASDLELPPLAGGHSAKFRRGNGDACAGAAATTTTPTMTTTSTSSAGSKPSKIPKAPDCTYVGPEPPVINEAFCTCDGKSSLLSRRQVILASNDPNDKGAGDRQLRIHSPADGYPNQESQPYAESDDQLGRIGAATVEAGSSAINVGTLTSDALYTSVSRAIESLCPPATKAGEFAHCATEAAAIKGITYVAHDELLLNGELVVQVKSSQYNLTSLGDALIKSAAMTAKFSTSEKNSYVATYSVLQERRWWHGPTNLAKRTLGLSVRDHPTFHQEEKTLYRAVDFAGAHYYSPFINVGNIDQGTDYIDVDFSFKAGKGADLICDFLTALIDGLAIVAPEFTVGDIELGAEVGFLCKEEADGQQKRDSSPNPHYHKKHAPLMAKDLV